METIATKVEDCTELSMYFRLLTRTNRGWFPGVNPIGMEKKDLMLDLKDKYLVCEKTDGMRYMLFTTQREAYFVDRNNVFYRINSHHLNPAYRNSVLDGELVVRDGKPWFHIFDALVVANEYVGDKSFIARLKAAHAFWVGWKATGDFELCVKSMYGAGHAEGLWANAKGCDGLIFTHIDAPYKAGKILKWKPPHMNTIDFGIGPERDYANMYVSNRGKLQKFEGGCVYIPPEIEIAPMGVAECSLVVAPGGWQFVRLRPDKPLPNAVRTVESVLRSLKDPVTEDVLFGFLESQCPKRSSDGTPGGT